MDRRTSKLAATAFALGLLGFFACAGLAAIILGVVSLRRIKKSGGRLGGRGLAIGGIMCALVILPFLGMVYSVSQVNALSPAMICGTNLSQIGKAMLIYANDHDDKLPTPSKWCDILLKTGQVEPRMLQCAGARRPPARSD